MRRKIAITLLALAFIIFYSDLKMNQNNPEVLHGLLDSVENYIEYRDEINTDVSTVDVAWQLDHILKVMNRITEALEKSKPENYSSSVNVMRVMSLTCNYIPRGRAQSPEIVKPPDVIHTEDIYTQLEEARNNIIKLKSLNDNSYFKHFVFGKLNKAQTIRFIEVHTNHHLKIVKDIIGK
ncbi:MAG: DUF1569 domain-containing protein [Winogradskyella sp.]|uniref:DUF1569 domain-containing protein n=1 Tax=Winogradskyella sp. TaxID=1883156 RepID=UPI000F3D52EF|nr:DUF1569 domain-containing protein [Winogradskyella sp.]RNC87827.1 MAG: DUF1569 domain-containing protein [Winogradskyella sp.]